MSNYAEIPQHIKDLANARAEIEQLRGHIELLLEGDGKAQNEIERLRERINNALDALNDDDISGATLILYEGVREALGE